MLQAQGPERAILPRMLATGSTLGPYRIEREIGRGGMGVIFLAQDTRLGRAAAIKALPEEVASDPERLSRFEREAKSLASLSHPNVAGIYGLEESDGRRFLALEYVEGESLAERLSRGPLSVQDAIEVGVLIAAGIEAAHEAGIIHRDLKPGNVVITASDVAKVLDFGLAKGGSGDPNTSATSHSPTMAHSPTLAQSPTLPHSPTLAHSPTLQTPATMPGVILGTAAYLSPEQARGKVVDRRTDIWSFGCLLYECLTGKQVFAGETVSDTIAKILEREVDWAPLPAATPAALRALLARCLEKDARRRLRDIGDARLTLEELKAGRSTAALAAVGAAQAGDSGVIDSGAVKAAIAKGRRGRAVMALAAFAVGVVVASGAAMFLAPGGLRSGGGGSAAPVRLSLMVPPDVQLQNLSMSPDGRAIVMQGAPRDLKAGEERVSRLFTRAIDGDKFQPLTGTDYAAGVALYPDGKWLCFLQRVSERSRQLRLMKMPLDGSAPAAQIALWDDSWDGPVVVLESGDLLATVAPGDSYVRIPAEGGTPSPPAKFDLEGRTSGTFLVHALPGDRGVFFISTSYVGSVYTEGVGVLDLKTGKSKILMSDAGSPRYSSTGHLLFSRHEAIFAVPFDLAKLEVTGKPTAILDGLRIANAWMNGNFGMPSQSGTVYFPPGGFVGKDRHLVMVDSEGRVAEWSGERLPFEVGASASPDGERCLSVVATSGALYEVWISERGRTAARRLISKEGADVSVGVWSSDGSKIAYAQIGRTEEDGVYVMSVGGSAPPRRVAGAAADIRYFPWAWTRDGSQLLLTRISRGTPSAYIVPVSPAGDSLAEPRNLFPGVSGSRGSPTLTADNGLIAYLSDESGRNQIHVQAWNGTSPVGESVPVGIPDAQFPMWSRDGKRLLALDAAGRCLETVITRTPRLSASPPRVLWNVRDLKLSPQLYSMLPDGRVLGIRQGEAEDEVRYVEVILNFPTLMKERLARAGAR